MSLINDFILYFRSKLLKAKLPKITYYKCNKCGWIREGYGSHLYVITFGKKICNECVAQHMENLRREGEIGTMVPIQKDDGVKKNERNK